MKCFGPPKLSAFPIASSWPPQAKLVYICPTGQASTKSTSPEVAAGLSQGCGEIHSGAAHTEPQLLTSKSNSMRCTSRKSTTQDPALQAKQPVLAAAPARFTYMDEWSGWPLKSLHMPAISPRTGRLQEFQVPLPASQIQEASPTLAQAHPSVPNGVPVRFCAAAGTKSTAAAQILIANCCICRQSAAPARA
eukprot:CAMPEP_0181460398 /NCGR_PEP_ID=MMETSP1110-20121109/33320_1 /TAXON_ID=174948 /ORGANISM="Symbiodinium sp., Strain CCMP421" /LENGTH=191 /DNA_ID=CAMNT_0023584947 /DNA_START=441 /DNA_END=1012 /DNA_ORIENTATION=-